MLNLDHSSDEKERYPCTFQAVLLLWAYSSWFSYGNVCTNCLLRNTNFTCPSTANSLRGNLDSRCFEMMGNIFCLFFSGCTTVLRWLHLKSVCVLLNLGHRSITPLLMRTIRMSSGDKHFDGIPAPSTSLYFENSYTEGSYSVYETPNESLADDMKALSVSDKIPSVDYTASTDQNQGKIQQRQKSSVSCPNLKNRQLIIS